LETLLRALLLSAIQSGQFTGHEWQTFLRDHHLFSSMSRRGNCHDNAVAESFFQLLKRERTGGSFQPVTMRERTSSTSSKCSTTHSAVIRQRQDYSL
jgi:transposase InsO family protein